MSSQFSPGEVQSIIIAWMVLSVAISYQYIAGLVNGVAGSIEFVAAGFIATATGFVLHEMGHKFVAVRRGYVAHFRTWTWGLAITLLTAVASGGGIVFGAPGAVYIAPTMAGYYSSPGTGNPEQENMIISAAGPGINLAFAIFFLILLLFSAPGRLISIVSQFGFALNVGLGSFNMLPIPPLDGSKIFRKSIPVALAIALPLWAMVLYFFVLQGTL